MTPNTANELRETTEGKRLTYGLVQVPSLYCQQLTPPW